MCKLVNLLQAGIQAGDILLSVDGKPIFGQVSLLAAVQQAATKDAQSSGSDLAPG